MRTYYDIHLSDRRIDARTLEGESIVKAGRSILKPTASMRCASSMK